MTDRLSIVWALRDAERRGLIEASADLREFAASLRYTAEEVDRAFELLSGWGRGALIEPTEIPDAAQRIDELAAEGLIEATGSGGWRSTEKGAQMRALLIAYLDPAESWQANGRRARDRGRERVEGQRRRPLSAARKRRPRSRNALRHGGLSPRGMV